MFGWLVGCFGGAAFQEIIAGLFTARRTPGDQETKSNQTGPSGLYMGRKPTNGLQLTLVGGWNQNSTLAQSSQKHGVSSNLCLARHLNVTQSDPDNFLSSFPFLTLDDLVPKLSNQYNKYV